MTAQIPRMERLDNHSARLECRNQSMKCSRAFISIILLLGAIICCQNSQTQSQPRNQSLAAQSVQGERFVLVSEGKVKAQPTPKESQRSFLLGGTEIHFAALFCILLIFGAPAVLAFRAMPLGPFSYRWAAYGALMSALSSAFFTVAFLYLFLYTIPYAEGSLLALLGILASLLCCLAAIGLFYRMKAGAAFLIASEVPILVILIAMSVQPPSVPASLPGIYIFLFLTIITANILYFRKRWNSMTPGLWPKVNARRFAAANFTWEEFGNVSGWVSRDPDNDDWILWDENNSKMRRKKFSDRHGSWDVSQDNLEQCLALGRRFANEKRR